MHGWDLGVGAVQASKFQEGSGVWVVSNKVNTNEPLSVACRVVWDDGI
jgi:hypothetical protein